MSTLIDANITTLHQGIECLRQLPMGWYTRSCAEVFGSSIGGHFRHNLDHLEAFLDGYPGRQVDYDARARDPLVEREPEAAISLMERQAERLLGMGPEDLDTVLTVFMEDGDGSSSSQSSLRRELQFLLSHTIHHYALIVAIANRYGELRFPAGFGIAPSTLSFRADQTS